MNRLQKRLLFWGGFEWCVAIFAYVYFDMNFGTWTALCFYGFLCSMRGQTIGDLNRHERNVSP